MINFNKDSAWDLVPIPEKSVHPNLMRLLLPEEELVAAFKTVRDQFIFTDRRLISVDVQGITGKRVSFSILPYANIQYFAVQTPFALELFKDSELDLWFSNGMHAHFEFRGDVDILRIGQLISEYVLTK